MRGTYRLNIARRTDEYALKCRINYCCARCERFQCTMIAVIFWTSYSQKNPIYINLPLTPIMIILAAPSFYLMIHLFDWLQ